MTIFTSHHVYLTVRPPPAPITMTTAHTHRAPKYGLRPGWVTAAPWIDWPRLDGGTDSSSLSVLGIEIMGAINLEQPRGQWAPNCHTHAHITHTPHGARGAAHSFLRMIFSFTCQKSVFLSVFSTALFCVVWLNCKAFYQQYQGTRVGRFFYRNYL